MNTCSQGWHIHASPAAGVVAREPAVFASHMCDVYRQQKGKSDPMLMTSCVAYRQAGCVLSRPLAAYLELLESKEVILVGQSY